MLIQASHLSNYSRLLDFMKRTRVMALLVTRSNEVTESLGRPQWEEPPCWLKIALLSQYERRNKV